MRRTLIQFDEQTYRKLRQAAFRQERSISSLVRDMVTKGLDGDAAREQPKHIGQFLSVRAGRSKQTRSSAVSEKHDVALAATFDK
jgi:plasmid stability protein